MPQNSLTLTFLKIFWTIKKCKGTLLMVQWLRFRASIAGVTQVQSLVGKLRAHMLCSVVQKKENPAVEKSYFTVRKRYPGEVRWCRWSYY